MMFREQAQAWVLLQLHKQYVYNKKCERKRNAWDESLFT